MPQIGIFTRKEEFPPEKIITMSPAKLAAERRKKERKYGLERKEMGSGTVVYPLKAEEFKQKKDEEKTFLMLSDKGGDKYVL